MLKGLVAVRCREALQYTPLVILVEDVNTRKTNLRYIHIMDSILASDSPPLTPSSYSEKEFLGTKAPFVFTRLGGLTTMKITMAMTSKILHAQNSLAPSLQQQEKDRDDRLNPQHPLSH